MISKRFALLIGNATYPQGAGLSPLRCPVNDVHGMAELLSAPERGGYTVRTLQDQPHATVREAAFDILTSATRDDLVLIYYSGHGKLDGDGSLFLATADTRSSKLLATAFPVEELKKFIQESPAQRIVVILDCCYSGALAGAFKGDVSGQVSSVLHGREAAGKGVYYLTASTDIQLAEERHGDRNSLLTKHIIAGIREGSADRDGDGVVTVQELLRYVQDQVPKEGRQKPQGFSFRTEDGHLFIANVDTASGPVRLGRVRDSLQGITDDLGPSVPRSVVRAQQLVESATECTPEATTDEGRFIWRLYQAHGSRRDLILISSQRTWLKSALSQLHAATRLPSWWRRRSGYPISVALGLALALELLLSAGLFNWPFQVRSYPLPWDSKPEPKAGKPANPVLPPPEAVEPAKPALPPPPETVEVRPNRSDGQRYVFIPPGEFMMGCSEGDRECDDDEKPPQKVELTRGFWIGQTEVTQAAYEKVMKTQNRSYFKGADRPVEQVSWDDANAYCKAVGMGLPTEAQWECAARAGSKAARYGDLDQIAWYRANSKDQTQPVAAKAPNDWGLYDMLGNVWEWVADWYDEKYYDQRVSKDPLGPATGAWRVVRGGSWFYSPKVVRVSFRSRGGLANRNYLIGFRCAGELR